MGCLFNNQRAKWSCSVPQGASANRKRLETAVSDLISRKIDLCEVLGFRIKPSVHGSAGGDSWCYQENTVLWWHLNLQLSVGRELRIFSLLQMFFFFCKRSILQNGCWWGFSWRSRSGAAGRAGTLRLPRSALLPATCARFCNVLIDRRSDLPKGSVDTNDKSGC